MLRARLKCLGHSDSAEKLTNGTIADHDNEATIAKLLLDSLEFARMDSRLQNVRTAHTRTCMWLFERDEYKDWRDVSKVEEHHGFLWIKGKPGCGKSTIMKTAFLRAKKERSRGVTISYFFNARASDSLEKSSLGMYRSLVHQLLQAIPELPCEFKKQFRGKANGVQVEEWTIIELQNYILSVVENIQDVPLTIFIDALDEGEDNDIRDMVAFLEELGDVSLTGTASFHICLSSRHYPRINIRNGVSLIVENQQGHDQDIIKYVRNKLSGDNSPRHETLMSDICQKASGVFLWVVLVVPMLNALYDKGQEAAMQKRLQEIPRELNGLFAEILGRNVDDGTKNKSVLLFQWVLFSYRPLSPMELYLAVESGTVSPDDMAADLPSQERVEKCILDCSKGLTEFSKSQPPTILFIHETIRGYLLHSNGLSILQPELGLSLAGTSHEELRRCCMQFFKRNGHPESDKDFRLTQSDRNEEIKKARVEFPFLEYAANHVFNHANSAEAQGISQRPFLRSLQSNYVDLQRWVRFRNMYERYPVRSYPLHVTLLYVFSETNQLELAKTYLKDQHNFDGPETRYGSALQAACANGHEQIARILIDAGADINAESGEYGHPLAAAILRKHNAIVQPLRQKGATIPQALLDKSLSIAIQNQDIKSMTLLLELGANVDAPRKWRDIPLLAAVQTNSVESVELLLKKGARIDSLSGVLG